MVHVKKKIYRIMEKFVYKQNYQPIELSQIIISKKLFNESLPIH